MKEHIFRLRKLKADCIDSGVIFSDGEWHSIVVASFKGHSKWETVAAMGSFIADAERLLMAMESQDTAPTIAQDQQAPPQTQPIYSAMTAAQQPTSSFIGRPPFTRPSRRATNRPLCTNCKRGYHTVENCWAPGGGATDKRPPGYRVPPDMIGKERAHLAELRRQLEQERVQQNESVQTAKFDGEQQRHFMMAAINSQPYTFSRWLIDSGATSHFVNDRSAFETYQVTDQSNVGLPNGHAIVAEGTGTVRIRVQFRGVQSEILLRDVVHVPKMVNNLVSVKKLLRDGIVTEFSLPDNCVLIRDGVTIARTQAVGELWELDSVVIANRSALVTTRRETEQTVQVWHQRLAHFDVERIKELNVKDLVTGLMIKDAQVNRDCEACVLSKMTALPAVSREPRSQQPGDVIHADLEFMAAKSFSGAEISLKFIDKYSNYVWAVALMNKESTTILKEWKRLYAEFQTQYGRRIKAIHTDNGAEFSNSLMADFNQEQGIQHRLTVPYRHEMNGRAKRMNRTGSDAVRAMLTYSGLPFAYWAEAYATFAYVHNRVGRSSITGKTPYEVLNGHIPDVSHIRTFGSTVYIRVPPERRRKLEAKALKCILLGYRGDAAYRLMDPSTRQIHYSRDVIFDEHKKYSDASIMNEIYLERENDGDVPLPDSNLEPPSKAIHRSNRPHKPTEKSIVSHEQEVTLRYLDSPPGLAEQSSNTILQRYVQNVRVPRTIHDALASSKRLQWIEAMKYEDQKLTEMGCWRVVERPLNTHVIGGSWVFNVKEQANGSLEYRARWVARGDYQIPGLEFTETFAVSGDFITAKVIIALSAHVWSCLVTIDITSAYLNSPLHELVYVEYPTGFSVDGFRDPVCKLLKALYGLRQGARAWSEHFSHKLDDLSFQRCVTAPSVYVRSDNEGETLLATHVDDCNAKCTLFSGELTSEAKRFKCDIGRYFQFKEKDPNDETVVLGMNAKFDASNKCVKLTVRQKIERALDKYGLNDTPPVRTPMATRALTVFDCDRGERFDNPPFPYAQLVGELLWMATILRVDIAFAVNVLARYMHKPGRIHWMAARRVLLYLKGTSDLGLVYRFESSELPIAYADADWGGDLTDRKSTTGFVVMVKGAPVSWKSKKQTVVAKSTAEAEYIAVSACAQEVVWLRNFFSEVNRTLTEATSIYTDNDPALEMTENPVNLSKTKHIDIPVHHVRDEVKKGRIKLIHVPGAENPADMLTKPLGVEKHYACIAALGME